MEDDDEYDGDLLKFPDEVNNGVIEERTVPLSDSKSKSTCTSTDTLQYYNMIQ